MTQQYKNSALALAIVAGLVSLPMTWVTVTASIQGESEGTRFSFGGMAQDYTGFNSYVTNVFTIPIWVVVSIAIVACLLQLMRNTKMFAIPRVAEWGSAIISLVWIGTFVFVGMFQATLGMGSFLGLFCAAVPIICLVTPTSEP